MYLCGLPARYPRFKMLVQAICLYKMSDCSEEIRLFKIRKAGFFTPTENKTVNARHKILSHTKTAKLLFVKMFVISCASVYN